jgi:hypothetical protein
VLAQVREEAGAVRVEFVGPRWAAQVGVGKPVRMAESLTCGAPARSARAVAGPYTEAAARK